MSDLLVKKVREAQRTDCVGQDAMLCLLSQFGPLMKTYIRRLHLVSAEDAEASLTLHFIQIIRSVDLNRDTLHQDNRLAGYIIKSMYNAYIHLSKAADKSRLCIPISNYTGADDENGGPPGWLESKMSYEPAFDANIVLEDLLGVLTKREADIIRCHFIWGYGTRRIARILNVSESAVSKSKRRALEKLKAYIIEQDKALKNT